MASSLSFSQALKSPVSLSELDCVVLNNVAKSRSVSAKLAIVRCQQTEEVSSSNISRRVILSTAVSLTSALAAFQAGALLDQDDDEVLLERIKKDRESRIKERVSRGNFKDETSTIQKAVYRLSKAGQALDDSDFSAATVILASPQDSAWFPELIAALEKGSVNSDEASVASEVKSSISALQSAVLKDDVDAAERYFIFSATALEKWITMTGLTSQIIGL